MSSYMAYPARVYEDWLNARAELEREGAAFTAFRQGLTAAALDAVALARMLESSVGNSLLSLNRSEVITTLLTHARSQGAQAGIDVEALYDELAEWRRLQVIPTVGEQTVLEPPDSDERVQPHGLPAPRRVGRLSPP